MKPMLLSIIIPVYNAEDTIRELLDSILQSKNQDIEIILVDDGSTDNSLTICKRYAQEDRRITVLHKANGGVSSARNYGLNVAKGDYIFFCDSDDVIIDKVLCEAINNLNYDVDIYFFDYLYVFTSDNRISKSAFKLKQNELLDKKSIISNIISPLVLKNGTDMAALWNKFFKREIIEKYQIRFEEEVYKGEDWRFILDFLAEATTAYYVPEVLYEYRLDGTQSESKYRIAVGRPALGSVKRKLALNEQFHLGADSDQILKWYCQQIEQVIISIQNDISKEEIHKMLDDPTVKKATKTIRKTKGKKLIEFEIPRKYKLYSLLIEKRMYRLLVTVCRRFQR